MTLIDVESVKAYLSGLPGVTGVHDWHIWGMSTTETALTAHLVKQNSKDDDALMERASKALYDRFGIEHTTLQWERRHDLVNCGVTCKIDTTET
jgi:cobalt-zinc-cadmium efflux system protein